MLRSTVLLCTIAVQVLSAPNPNGCIESCTTYQSQSTHEALIQQQQAALSELNQLAASQLKGSQVALDYTRPGNWTEHNEYHTDGGAGRVYEEQGQIVNGGRRVQYYKKNYSSSHGLNVAGNSGLPNYGDAQSTLLSQRLTGVAAGGLENVGHQSSYDEESHRRIHQSINSAVGQSGRLEDFSVDGAQTLQHGQVPSTSNGRNWHTSNSWKTDGGRGVVYEEQGQVVDGPSRVTYRRKNYTSSFSSGDAGAGVPSILQPNLESELDRIKKQFDSFGREIHQTTVGQNSLDVDRTAGHNSYVNENHFTSSNIQQQQQQRTRPATSYETTNEEQQATIHRGVVSRPVTRNYHRTADEQYHETGTSGIDYNAENSRIDDNRSGHTSQQLYVIPSRPLSTVQRTEAHQTYQKTIVPQITGVHASVNDHSIDRGSDNLIRVPIHTNTDYRSFHGTGRDYHNTQNTHQSQQILDEIMQNSQQHTLDHQNINRQSGYVDGNVETINVVGQPTVLKRVEENWSASGHRSESTIPQSGTSGQLVRGYNGNYVRTGQSGDQLGSYGSLNSHSSHGSQRVSGSSLNEGFRSRTGQLVTGTVDLGQVAQVADCDQGVTTSQQYQYGSVHQRHYKRDAGPRHHHRGNEDLSQQTEDLTQQTEDLTQQTEDLTQQTEDLTQQSQDLTQQSGGFGDYTQQQQSHNGKLEFGQETQQTEDLTQQSSGFGDYTQQQSGKIEFGQHTQQPEDLTQQTSGFGDYSQQQSGKLELGHQSQQSEDLTQQTSGFGDYTQQQSGKLEFGQQSQQPADLTQQTSGFGDYSQQQSGKLEFGQQSQQPEDLTQQTSGFGDYTQQQSGKLEFGQQQQQHSGKLEFGQHSQQVEDLTQQASGFGDYTQQQSGKIEFGQQNQQAEDLTQQTSGFGDYTQQTTGNLESGQQTQQSPILDFNNQNSGSWSDAHVAVGHKEIDDLTQQSEDLTHQISGTRVVGKRDEHQHTGQIEFGQQSQQSEDLTQQTSGFGDYTQQQSGKLEFGQHSQQPEDLTQQTSGFGDYTQQQSGKLEFGQQSQQPEDLTQQTSGFGDYTQQTSGNLEFGQQEQQQQQQHSGKLEFGQHKQQVEDLTQQTSGFGDYTQQTSGNLEFGQQHEQQAGKLEFGQHTQYPANQQTEDLSQQTQHSGFGDYTQQASGNLEFGQQRQQTGELQFGQHTQHPANQQIEDLSQQTQQSGFGDYTQQVSGNLEFGQQQQHTGELQFGQHKQHPANQQTEDLSQQTQQNGFGDYTQQTSGNLEFGQQQQQTGELQFGQHTQHPANQQTEDLSQQTQQSGFGDYTQQTSGNLEFGQQQQQTGELQFGQHRQHPANQQTEDLSQQTSGNLEFGQQQQTGNIEFGGETTTIMPTKIQNPGVKGGRRRKPAPKPTLRQKQRRPHSGNDAGDTDIPTISNSPFDAQPELDLDNAHHSTNVESARLENAPRVQSIEDRIRAAQQQSSLNKNPSAQWHLTHNSGDLTNSENFGNPQVSQDVEQHQQKDHKFQENSAVPESRRSRQNDPAQGENNGEKDSKFESRILEAYGGNGAYDAGHNEDIFGKAKVNPSATLAPKTDPSQDPWYIREKPIERRAEMPVEKPVETSTERPVEELDPTRITFPTDAPEEATTTPASFWRRVGNKLSSTYEKAKEKATGIFGK